MEIRASKNHLLSPLSPVATQPEPSPLAPRPVLNGDQVHLPAPGRSPIQSLLSLWQENIPAPGPADRQWAVELLEKTRRNYHPSVAEMGRYRQLARALPDLPQTHTLAEVVPVMQNIFSQLDHNGNGFLAEDELKAAIRNPKFRGAQALAVATLYKLGKSIQKASWNEWKQTSGVHIKDLQALERMANKEKPSKWTLYVESYVFNQSVRFQQNNPQLFPQGQASIRPDHIFQGDYGTCTLLAAAGSLAATPQGKAAIQKMIQALPDGQFEVRFPGEPPLKVARPTDSEQILYANAGPDGLWLSVLEKAFVKRMETKLKGLPLQTVEKAVNDGLYLADGIQLLTGAKAESGSIPQTPLQQLRHFITQTVGEARIVLVTLNPESPQAKEKELKQKTGRQEEVYNDGLVGLHAYSVIGFDPASDTITLYNPWGNTEWGQAGQAADGVNDGRFSLSLTEFQRHFSDISWQTREALKP